MSTWISLWARTISPYYAVAVLVTTLAFILSFWYTSYVRKQISKSDTKSKSDERHEDERSDADEEQSGSTLDTIQSRIKIAKQQALIDHLGANLTKEQLIEEKEVERAQLAAIFNLLKEQKDKFQVSNMEELEQQMSLYR